MTTRQEAITNALQWAEEAETRHGTAERPDQLKEADAARRMAVMWADLAHLLPAVLTDHQLDQQTAPEPPTPDRCPSQHAFTGGEEHCERQAGHHGIHTARGLQWPNPSQPNAAPATNLLTSVPTPRQAADNKPPRCPSRRDGEQCERAAGHSGIHQGTTCGWRTYPVHPAPVAPAAGLCCQQAVAHVAEQLEQHARTAPGLTELERRCLEDAADFVRAHVPAATAPEPSGPERPCDLVFRGHRHPEHYFLTINGPTRCPGRPA